MYTILIYAYRYVFYCSYHVLKHISDQVFQCLPIHKSKDQWTIEILSPI